MRRQVAVICIAVLAIIIGAAAQARAGDPHTVRPGETLSEIAVDHGTTVQRLVDLNGLTNRNFIRVGQVLVISSNVHVVQRGETLSGIAVRYSTTTTRLLQLNPSISNRHRIFPGMRISVDSAAPRTYANLPSDIRNSSLRSSYIPYFEKWAAEYDVAPDLLMALAYSESNWRVNARPRDSGGNLLSSAYGIGQVLSGTARWINSALIPGPFVSRYEAEGNIQLTARYLGWLIDLFDSERLGTGAYMQGQGSVLRDGLNQDAVEYIERIERRREFFR